MFARIALLAGLLSCLTSCAGIKPLPFERRILAAVMPFGYQAADQKFAGIAPAVAESVSAGLIQSGRIRLLERQRVDDVLAETKYGMSGMVDSKTAASVGKQLGAQAVVVGAVVSVSVREEGRSVKIAEKTTRWADVEAEARLVDVETGEILAVGRGVGKAQSAEKHAFGGKIGELATPEALVQKAVAGLGDSLAKDLAKGIPPKQ